MSGHTYLFSCAALTSSGDGSSTAVPSSSLSFSLGAQASSSSLFGVGGLLPAGGVLALSKMAGPGIRPDAPAHNKRRTTEDVLPGWGHLSPLGVEGGRALGVEGRGKCSAVGEEAS